MWWFYELFFVLGFCGYLPRAVWRRRLPHRGWSMRLGRYPTALRRRLAGGTSIWVHAVSVGEVLAVRPLVRSLARTAPHQRLVLSTITPGGFELAKKQLADAGDIVYFPLDVRLCVRRALATLRPALLLLAESELWPMTIRLAGAQGIPIAVVNGRISPRSFRRYRAARPWLAGLFGHVDLFLMQSQTDAKRIVTLGAPPHRVRVTGSLKWDATLGARPAPGAISDLAERIGLSDQEAVIVAGSTHRGEEEALLRAYRAARGSIPACRLIIAPRHLERLSDVGELVQRAGFSAVRLSEAAARTPWDVGLVDSFGQMPLYYGLARVAFIGGSLIPHGGQNPLEAASLGKPVVFGPSMHNFDEIARQLVEHGAARQLAGADELGTALQDLLVDRDAAQQMGRRAQQLTERSQGALQRTLEALAPLLERGCANPSPSRNRCDVPGVFPA